MIFLECIGSRASLSAELTGQKWTVNVQLLQYSDIVGVFLWIYGKDIKLFYIAFVYKIYRNSF